MLFERVAMDKNEAKLIFDTEVNRFQNMPFNDLVQLFNGDLYTEEHIGTSGVRYLFEIKTKWKKSLQSKHRFSASLRCLDDSQENTKTWNIPFLNSAISSTTMTGIFTSFTRKPE